MSDSVEVVDNMDAAGPFITPTGRWPVAVSTALALYSLGGTNPLSSTPLISSRSGRAVSWQCSSTRPALLLGWPVCAYPQPSVDG